MARFANAVSNLVISQSRQRTYFVAAFAIFVILLLTYQGSSYKRSSSNSWVPSALGAPQKPKEILKPDNKYEWDYYRDAKNLQLSNDQCDIAFPQLFVEIDRATKAWDNNSGTLHGISLADIDAVEPKNGYVRAMIYEGSLYIIAVRGEVYRRHYATLAAIHRALVTNPSYIDEPIRNIEFTFNVDDVAESGIPQWTYARRTTELDSWLMPDFGFYSWPETKVGSYDEVQRKALAMERGPLSSSDGRVDTSAAGGPYTWSKKIDKVMWRGATMGLEVREKLLSVSHDKDWADVIVLNWHDESSMKDDLKSMAEHCQYRYLVHTEGNSYSGRLKYLQNCESVLVAHKMDWVQHTQHLMASSGPNQNFVEVRRDFADLESTVRGLQGDSRIAKMIAANSVKTFRERYLTAAAEACYWRRLFKQWADVQTFEPELWGWRNKNGTLGHLRDMEVLGEGERVWRGVPWESYSLMRELDWMPQ